MLPDLITVDEYLTATGQLMADLETKDLSQIEWAITAASQAVRDYCDRSFVLVPDETTGPRTYTYQGHGSLEIDDAMAVTEVQVAPTTFDTGRTLDPTEYFAVTNNNGTIDELELLTIVGRSRISPEMGFRSNLDTLPVIAYPVQFIVTATWGWPSIPANVKQAMIWGTADFLSDAGPYNTESIANYSRTVSSMRSASAQVVNALPERALALLEGYLRWPV